MPHHTAVLLAGVAVCATGLATPALALAASPDDTRVASAGPAIVDSTGARWTLNNRFIYVDGVRDPHSFNVVCLAYEDGHVWQENAARSWYRKTKPSDTWAPSGGTTNSPLPPITATVSGGALHIRTDPQTVVGITALGANNAAKGSISRVTDNVGDLTVPVGSLFGAGTYLVSEFRLPLLLSGAATIAMFSLEYYFAYNEAGDQYLYDMTSTYGPNVRSLDWTTLVGLQKSDPASFAAFVKSLGADQAYVSYKGNTLDPDEDPYVVKTAATKTTTASIANELFLDTANGDDPVQDGRVGYANSGTAGYAFDTIGAIKLLVP